MERIILGVSVQRSGTMTRLATMLSAAMLAGVLGTGVSALAQTDGQGAAAGQTPAASAQATEPAASAQSAAGPAASAPVANSTIQGVVKAGGVPLPGVAVTAVSGDSKKYATTTDINGAFRMDVPAGTYQVRTQLMGFATLNKQVVATPADAMVAQQLVFTTDLASRMPDQEPGNGAATTTASSTPAAAAPGAAKPAGANAGAATSGTASGTTATASNRTPGAGARRPGGYGAGGGAGGARRSVTNQARGTQSLDVQSGDDQGLMDATAGSVSGDVSVPSIGGFAGGDDPAAATDSIAVTGQQGQINGLAMFSEGDLQGRIREMQANGFGNGDIAGALTGAMQTGTFGGPNGGPGAGGGFGGPGGGPGGFGGGGGGGFRGGGGGGGGGFRGGGGGGGRGGFGGPGGFRGQNPNAWHGTVGYNGFNNAINATPFSVTGIPLPKPDRSQNSLTASFTGTPFIPHLMAANPKQFMFVTISETRASSPSSAQYLVPTLAQRYGDLTPAYQVGTPLGGTSANPNTNIVYDPFLSTPGNPKAYGNTNCDPRLLAIDPNPTACIPVTELNSAAQTLLANYYPLPNINATGTQDNFQANFPGSSHSSQVSARFNRSFGAQPTRGRGGFGGGGFGGGGFGGGPGGGGGQNRNVPLVLRQSIAENFSYSHSATASSNFSPLLGGHSTSEGYSFSSSYTIGYGRLNNSASLSWNRSTGLASNFFTNGAANPAVQAGIYVGTPTIYSDPFYFGLPGIGITGGLAGLNDSAPNNTVSQTISFSDNARWNHRRHNIQLGFDFRRIHADSIGGGGVLGSFSFSGFATENPALQTCSGASCSGIAASGSSMADFLLGLPQNSNVTAGLNKVYLRGNSWDWFAQDSWQARPGLTFQYGLRWEYFSPYSEKYNRLVNLNVTGIGPTLAVSTVCGAPAPAGSPAGSCAAVEPGTLVHPDKNLYSPRLSVSWVPKFKFTKNMVVRSSYGINYNTGQYASFARNLAYQQPFYVTQKNVLSSGSTNTGCTLQNMTLNHGFNCSTAVTQSSYAVNPNYRLGMVQVYNLGIQKTLPRNIVMNIDYTGAYAGNLDMVRAPNRNASGVIVSSVGQFNYEDSLGYQRSNALAVNLRERMQKGVSLQATYTFSHSIDNASSVGGSGNSIAQNDQDLNAEESNSSFDRRHVLQGTFVLEPPVGPNRAFLNKGGFWSHALDGFNISGNFQFASGGWTTPTFSGTPQEIAAGASSLRPNRDYTKPLNGSGTLRQWFNTSVFTAPAFGTYGSATRNSIELPGTVSVSSSLSRSISFGETRSLEMRLNVSNVFNTVQYSGVYTNVNDTRFGQVSGAAGMRAFTYNMRYRF